ncbi:MAG: helicase-exonuclease AddAB subunit AddA [Oscillospiraceae bacterium]|jgi:ATP-dependent helicase/nuclease subunit A|nr:helicase-exonuclease AddAB subunit AddA [Oscillospiraceae bacterium]
MSETKWTQNQKNAINARNGTVLVSAGAGSGKTAVLVERVVKRLTDKISPCSADKLLIVTFTNAAAGEMKKRISNRLSEMIANNPNDINLKRQQILIRRANIGTIHSFCNNIVKDNFYRLNISPNFRISENGEISVLKDKAMNTLMDEFYNENDNTFLELVNTLSQEKNDSSFTDTIEEIYNFIRSFPFEEKWSKEKSNLYLCSGRTDITDTPMGKVIIKHTKESLEFLILLTKNSLQILNKDPNMLKAYFQNIQKNLDLFQNIYNTLNQDWDTVFENINSLKYDGSYDRKVKEIKDNPYKLTIDENKELINKTIKKIKSCFLYDKNENKSTLEKMHPLVVKLFEAVAKFGYYLDNLKKEKNIADFNDLEKWTLKLLTEQSQDGKVIKSQFAKEFSQKFEEIIVDEYQDTNETQNMIFKMMSKDEKNLFIVGDVKQSIYGFRQARPENFINKKNMYNNYNSEIDSYPAKIILDKNFRSTEGIINSVNFIFKNLMSEKTSDISYSQEEYLVCSDKNLSQSNTSLEIIYGKKDYKNSSSEIIESRRIADLISDMIDKKYMIKDKETTRPVKYSDICVLLRSAKTCAKIYSQELNKLDIPCFIDLGENFFDTYEISTILSILKVIDNPIQDIPLIAALMSPIFGFTPDDLSKIRLFRQDVPMYFAIKDLSDSGNVDCKKFMDKISSYRAFSAVMSVHDLINHIYADTGYTEIIRAMPKGNAKLSNLRLFLNYAKKYQNDICKDLSEFLLFIDRLIDKKINPIVSSNITSELSDEVRIMSIHKSKGLEFPVCILAGCSRQFNKSSKKVLIHPSLGVSFKLKDQKNIINFNNIQRQAIKIGINKQEISENLRILYVALTRAKQKLIIMSHVENIEEYLNKMTKLNDISADISPYIIKNCNCFLDWVTLCALKSSSGKKLYEKIGKTPKHFQNNTENIFDINISYAGNNNIVKRDNIIEKQISNLNIDNSLLGKIKERFEFVYPYSSVNKIPLKVTATDLLKKDTWKENIASSRPAFMSEINVSPGEKGTILHNFMYFADYNKATQNLDRYLSYIIEQGIMTPNEINVIDRNSIHNFFKSTIGQKILKANKLYREYRFTVNYTDIAGILKKCMIFHNSPPSAAGIDYANEVDFFNSNAYISGAAELNIDIEEESSILIGSIDCVFEDNDGEYVIVDYKTDKTNDINDLSNKYSRQLSIYKNAFEKCENVKVKELIIYSFYLNNFIVKTF